MATNMAQPDTPHTTGQRLPALAGGNPVSRYLARQGFYYGWTMTAVAFLCGLWSIGFIFYTYGLFRDPLRNELGWGVSTMTAAYAGYTILMALWGPLSARMTEKYGPKAVISVGAVILPMSLVMISTVNSKVAFFVYFSVIASFGTSALGMIPNYTALNHWFTTNKAQSFSWASAGISSAGLILVPFTQYLISNYGWRHAYKVNAFLLAATIFPLILLLFYNRPSDLGVDEETPPPESPDAIPDRLLEYREILRDKRFVISVLSLSLASACWSVILQSFVSDLTTRESGPRWDPLAAGAMFAVLGALCGIGKPIFGAVGDRMERRRAILLAISMQLIGFLLMLGTRWWTVLPFQIGNIHADALLATGILFYGLGVGGCLPLFSALHADQFGRLSFSRVSGLATPFNVAIISLMYLSTGAMYDRYQSYLPQSWVLISAYLVSLGSISILLVQVKRRRNPRKTFDTPLEPAEPV